MKRESYRKLQLTIVVVAAAAVSAAFTLYEVTGQRQGAAEVTDVVVVPPPPPEWTDEDRRSDPPALVSALEERVAAHAVAQVNSMLGWQTLAWQQEAMAGSYVDGAVIEFPAFEPQPELLLRDPWGAWTPSGRGIVMSYRPVGGTEEVLFSWHGEDCRGHRRTLAEDCPAFRAR